MRRDDVLDDIFAFLGVAPFRTPLPVMHVCKAERYRGKFEGCYNGSSKVWPETRKRWEPVFAECNARLARTLGVSEAELWGEVD